MQREAHHHPTVHIKGVTHYTLRGRSVKRSTNKIARTPFDFSADKSALWKVPVFGGFLLDYYTDQSVATLVDYSFDCFTEL